MFFLTYYMFGTNNETYIRYNDNYLATGDGNKISSSKCQNCIFYGTRYSDSVCTKRWYAPTIVDAGGRCGKFCHFVHAQAAGQDKLPLCKKLIFAIQNIQIQHTK